MTIEKYFGIGREKANQMINAAKNMAHDKSGSNGFQNTKVYLFEEYAVLKMQNMNFRNVITEDNDLKHLERLAETLLNLKERGVNVIPISAFISENGSGYIIQPKAAGAELYDSRRLNDKSYLLNQMEILANAPQRHFDKYVADLIKITDSGVMVDFAGRDNFFYHKSVGFQFIDLNAHTDYEYGLTDLKPCGLQIAEYNCFRPCCFDVMPEAGFNGGERKLFTELNNLIYNKCKMGGFLCYGLGF